MTFSSFPFLLVFLPAVLAGYWLALRHGPPRSAQLWLIVASLAFYGYSHPANLGWLGLSLLINASAGAGMARTNRPASRKRWLVSGLTANILLLGLLKYAQFAQATIHTLTGMTLPVPDWGLPLGISFFTITQVMYLMDCYERLVPGYAPLDHASLVVFFPVLTMGPLVRARQLLPQFGRNLPVGAEPFAKGNLLFAIGLIKKVLLAEAMAEVVDPGFHRPPILPVVDAWVSTIAYALRIYFDFSGYSDMAVGIGLMLGLNLPLNFQSPFKAASIIDYWQRWHISLTQFITTYLYTPILRRFGKATLRTSAIATLAAMGIAGLWHGASWNFVLFGLIHGAGLAVNQYWRKQVKRKLPHRVCRLLTLGLVLFAFVFFQAPTLAAALRMVRSLVPGGHPWASMDLLGHGIAGRINLLWFLLCLALVLRAPNSNDWAERLRPNLASAMAISGMFLLGLLYLNSSTIREFIYLAF